VAKIALYITGFLIFLTFSWVAFLGRPVIKMATILKCNIAAKALKKEGLHFLDLA